jgi:adenylyl-sulfate kinase
MMKRDNIIRHPGHITREDRAGLLGQQAMTIWMTGLSAAGKSTLAFALERELTVTGRACYVLDGDNVRHGLNRDLGFSNQDRHENIRRIAEVAKLMNDAGLIVITAFISPFRADRALAREIIGKDVFKEVYVSTPIGVCEQRDPKNLYQKARKGEVAEFTGISSPYETPIQAELALDTSALTQEQAVKQLTALLNA